MHVVVQVKRTAELEESDLAAVEAILEGNMRTFFDDWEGASAAPSCRPLAGACK